MMRTRSVWVDAEKEEALLVVEVEEEEVRTSDKGDRDDSIRSTMRSR